MKPEKCKCDNCTCRNCTCNLGHQRPQACNQTVFGLNLESRDDVIILHGDLKERS